MNRDKTGPEGLGPMTGRKKGTCCPTGAQYEPGEQVSKAKKDTTADSEGVVKNILG